MGARGPVPKREAQRRRTNKPETPVVKVEVEAGIVEPPKLYRKMHPLAEQWYAALTESGQSRWFEPSDWAFAQIVAESIDAFASGRRSAVMLQGVLSGASSLLTTEGDRRRLRIELSREDPAKADAEKVENALDELRKRRAG